MVSYYFPPYGEVGALRAAKFVKYLTRAGWRITVVTVREEYYGTRNEALLADVDGATVIRTAIRRPRAGIREWGLFWLPELRRCLDGLLRRERFPVSFWTGNPFYQMILAPWAKRRFGLSYVVDLRDPWRLNPYGGERGGIIRQAKFAVDKVIAAVLEPAVLRGAEAVINVTEQATDLYRRFYPSIRPDTFVTIHNGFDPEDFQGIEARRFSAFDIVYTGKFGTFRNPAHFFSALRSFISSRNLTPDDVRFVWVGAPEREVVAALGNCGLSSYAELTGFMPYRQALQIVKGAGLCLLISGRHPYEPTTKVFDYIGLGKPVLGVLGAAGFLSGLLAGYSGGTVTENNEESIIAALNTCYDGPPAGGGRWNCDGSAFDRRMLAAELEAVISRLV